MAVSAMTTKWTLILGCVLAAGFGAWAGLSADSTITQILGRPTDRSITVSVLASEDLEAFIEYGAKVGSYSEKTNAGKSQPGKPFEALLDRLKPNTRYYYRLRYRRPGNA